MHSFFAEDLARERQHELATLAAASHAAAQVRRARGVRPWRHAVGRFLVTVGVGVGLPRPERKRALRDARAVFCD